MRSSPIAETKTLIICLIVMVLFSCEFFYNSFQEELKEDISLEGIIPHLPEFLSTRGTGHPGNNIHIRRSIKDTSTGGSLSKNKLMSDASHVYNPAVSLFNPKIESIINAIEQNLTVLEANIFDNDFFMKLLYINGSITTDFMENDTKLKLTKTSNNANAYELEVWQNPDINTPDWLKTLHINFSKKDDQYSRNRLV